MLEKLLAALEAIGAGLRDLNVNLAAQANAQAKTTTAAEVDTPKPKKAATGAVSAHAATASISYQALAQKFTDLLEADRDKALSIFSQFGCKKRLTELKEDKYDAFAAAVDAAAAMPETEGGLV